MSENKQEKINVIVAADFSDEIMAQLREISPELNVERHYPDVPPAAWKNAEILYTIRHFPEPEEAPRLRWIQLHFAGMESVVTKRIVKEAEDVEITSASGIHAIQMAEYCLGMMLAFMYNIPRMMELKNSATWPEKRHEIFAPHGLRGMTLGITGYGSIARELARMAHTLGMTVLATNNSLRRTEDDGYAEPDTGDPDGEIPERLYPPEATATMASECDFLVVTTPLTEATYHQINESVLNSMKRSAILINVARGDVVDEKALISALAAEKIGGAALDVFEEEPLPASSPLWNLDNVIISPHVSGMTSRYHEKAAALFAENLRRYLQNQPLFNRLDRERGY
ncbi:MAG: D-2-hydroxyacid dehydrogenase [Aggregatilineales bacterium]